MKLLCKIFGHSFYPVFNPWQHKIERIEDHAQTWGMYMISGVECERCHEFQGFYPPEKSKL